LGYRIPGWPEVQAELVVAMRTPHKDLLGRLLWIHWEIAQRRRKSDRIVRSTIGSGQPTRSAEAASQSIAKESGSFLFVILCSWGAMTVYCFEGSIMGKVEGNALRAFASELAKTVIAVAAGNRANFEVEIKQDGSPVTNVDIAVEKAVRARIEAEFPDHGILGEELPVRNPDAEWMWVIDPIDGTRQFAAGLPNYGSLIALCHHGVPQLGIICQPGTSDIYIGISGQGSWYNGAPARTGQQATLSASVLCISDLDAFDDATRPGMERLRRESLWNVFDGGCLSFGVLATGRIGASVCGPNLDNFDICALVPVVEGAGGVITDWRGEPLSFASKGAIVASANRRLHDEVLALLNAG
jgi:inositol-phosphate phosphatase / L-galactose 1-phosphate phosphatase / histidinol-phosphatase